MSRLYEFELEDGGSVIVEVDEERAGERRVSRGDVISAAKEKLENTLDIVRPVSNAILQRLQAIATQMGLIILLLFMTFVIVLDVWKVTGH